MRNGSRKIDTRCRPCACVDDEGNVVKMFRSRAEAARWLGDRVSHLYGVLRISECCERPLEKAFGYLWRNVDVPPTEDASVERSLVGRRFGELEVVKALGINSPSGRALYACRCGCGAVRVYSASTLIHGKVKSCGCADSVRLLEESVRASERRLEAIKASILGGRAGSGKLEETREIEEA